MSAAEYDDQQPATLWAESGDDRVGDGGAVPAHTDQTATAGATAARDEADAAALAEGMQALFDRIREDDSVEKVEVR